MATIKLLIIAYVNAKFAFSEGSLMIISNFLKMYMSISPAKHLVVFETGAFQFWLKCFNPLG